jgi:hypothetical protein
MKYISKILMATIFQSSFVLAGDEIGNGGLGVVLNNRLMLLEFAENGISTASFSSDIKIAPDIKQRVDQKLQGTLCGVGRYADEICEMTAQKFSEIKAAEPILFEFLFFVFEELDYRVVSARLVPIDDVGASPIEYDKEQLRQLATRIDRTVRFDEQQLRYLPHDHLVGLIFHEVLYAMKVSENPLARKVRDTVAYLFSAESTRGLSGLLHRLPFNMGIQKGLGKRWKMQRDNSGDRHEYVAYPWTENTLRRFRINFAQDALFEFLDDEYQEVEPQSPLPSKGLVKFQNVCESRTSRKARISIYVDHTALKAEWIGVNRERGIVSRVYFSPRYSQPNILEVEIFLAKSYGECLEQLKSVFDSLIKKMDQEFVSYN